MEAGPKPCDGHQHESAWVNPFGTLYIVGGYVWQGVGRGCKADVGFQLYVQKTPDALPQLMRVGMWDHYQDPTGAEDNISPLDFGGHYFVVEHGGTVTLKYGATLIGLQEGPDIDAGQPHGVISPWNYFANLMGQHQQAYLLFSLTKPE